MGKAFDLSLFTLPETLGDASSSLAAEQPATLPSTTTSVGQQVNDGEFLAGPIRIGWIEAAANLPGAALPVALAVRHLHVMRGRDWVVLSNAAVRRFGVSSSAKARAVVVLEGAGLIEVQDRRSGCAPRVRPIGD
ncbi:hypothetical protein NBRC116601_17310 [Cognatishimia sp. WU-CL00825]|uniref:hypothetical protein n=1 Tax=Cognatishimia sp. WU-CL00825 TaxID=3127658 RepID=UPI003107963C